MDILYKKNGKRYQAIGEQFTGFPADGIWLVQTKEGGSSSRLIMKVGELLDPKPLIELEMHRDEIVNVVSDTLKNTYSINSLVDNIFKALARKTQPKLPSTDERKW